MKTRITILCILCTFTTAFGQQHYPVDTLYKSGRLDNRINVVILGDGFTKAEMPKFASEARKFADYFRGHEPFNHYRDYFNIFSINTPSKESGITNPGTASDAYPDQPVEMKDTFYGVSFGEYIHRMLYITKTDVYQDLLLRHLPAHKLVVIIANTKYVGGATGPLRDGGSVALFSLQENSSSVGVHELGHLFADLADEYWQYPYGLYLREGPNITADSSETTVKWKNWLDNPSIGVFRHGSEGNAAEWYKPSSGTCLMEVMGKDYCVVCREAVVERILELVDPIQGIEPDTTVEVDADKQRSFKVNLLQPSPNSLEITWYLNGKNLGEKGAQLTIPGQLPNGSELVATVFDSTSMSRKMGARKFREKKVRWVLRSANPPRFDIVASREAICEGDTVLLTAYGCAGDVSWSTGVKGKLLKINAVTSKVYKAECKVAGKPTLQDEISIVVKPLPIATASNGGPYVTGQTVQLIASGGTSYHWSGPRRFSAETPTATIPNATIHSSGIYEVKVTGENGCIKTAKTEVKIDPVLSVMPNEEGWLKVFPNPVPDRVSFETMLPGESEITLFNASGQKILRKSFQKRVDIDIDLPRGIYVCKFRNGNKEVSSKVVIE